MSAAEIAQIVADVLSFAALIGLIFSLRLVRQQTSAVADQARHAAVQAEHASHATLATVYQNMAMQMHDIDRYFVDNPELKKYFGEGAELPDDVAEQTKLRCIAEMLVDFMDNFVTQAPLLDKRLCSGWREYFVSLYDASPAIRAYVSSHHTWYTDELHDMLGTPHGATPDPPRTGLTAEAGPG